MKTKEKFEAVAIENGRPVTIAEGANAETVRRQAQATGKEFRLIGMRATPPQTIKASSK